MRETLTQLFGEAVTEEALKTFNAELGKKFVSKNDFNLKLERIKSLETDKKSLEDKVSELTESAQSAEDFKQKFEELKNEIAEKERKAEEDRKKKEKADGIKNRFDNVIGEREFTHEAVKADYLRKFTEALENGDYEGKSDSDIIHALTKDDASAFKGVTAFHIECAADNNFSGGSSDLGKLDMAEYIAARKNMKG